MKPPSSCRPPPVGSYGRQCFAAVPRLFSLKDGMKAENLTSSLAGILRTIRKYGYKNLNNMSSLNTSMTMIGCTS